MKELKLKERENCRWDEVSLGEIMLRLDPGEGRVRTAREFSVWEGGGEYNVAKGLSRCFGLNTCVVTSLPENEIGALVQDFVRQGGVDTSHIRFVPYDGIGREARVGLNFTERGYGARGALGVSDRAHTAASAMKSGDIDWDEIFGREGARWFHTGGIYAALSETTPGVVIDAMKTAKANGTIVSYDLNYRPSLWKANGGKSRAQEVNRELAQYVDVMLGNEEDFTAALGFEVEGLGEDISGIQVEKFKKMLAQVTRRYPNFAGVATTLREVKSATINDWGAILSYGGEYFEAQKRENLEILDRVGGGDSFASGLIYGFLTGRSPNECIELGAAHGALVMTTPGDTSMASLREVEKLAGGGGARVER
ncbi:MAG TPA: sugar kinase [Spirochaetia bacterium]|nr:sugar kinase [Spirochaetia bacterium]